MEHHVEINRQCRQDAVIGDRAEHELDFRMLRDVADVGRQQIVDNDKTTRPLLQQPAHQRTTDKPGAADHQHRAIGKH